MAQRTGQITLRRGPNETFPDPTGAGQDGVGGSDPVKVLLERIQEQPEVHEYPEDLKPVTHLRQVLAVVCNPREAPLHSVLNEALS